MDMQKILDRVRALQALGARSESLEEAQTAVAQAEAIIARYRLSQADVDAREPGRAEPINEDSEPLISLKRDVTWVSMLAGGLSSHYGCFVATVMGDSVKYKIFGRASDVAAVRFMFAWLRTEIDRLSQAERGKRAKNSFRVGAVCAVMVTLSETAKRAPSTEAGGAGVALVLASRAKESERYAQTVHKIGSAKTPMSVYDEGAFNRGLDAGGALHLGDTLPAATRALPERT